MPTSTPPGSLTTIADVHAVLDVADAVGATLWLDGGWGVDALLGEQTREHGDLDAAVEGRHLDALLEALHRNGFERVGERDAVPWNFLLACGRVVRCIAAEHAVRFHDAYPGDEKDRRDVLALCERFGLEVPAQYR